MSTKRKRKVCAAVVAAAMALSTSQLAFAQTAGTNQATNCTAGTITVMDVVEQAVHTAGDQVTQGQEPAMETVAVEVIAKQKADAKAAAKKVKAAKANKVAKVLDTASSLTGTPYVYGGSTPSGFDCSGFTMYCYAKAGVSLTHNVQAQYNETTSVNSSEMKKGDLVFFGSSTGSITHVGIYVGNGKFIHSPRTGESVRVDSLSSRSNFIGATRVIS